MKIFFHKISNNKHRLEIVRLDGSRESIECETRSFLNHDLLHYSLESEAHLQNGFWGSLARGTTLDQLNDRTGESLGTYLAEMMQIEGVVGPLSRLAKGETPTDVYNGIVSYWSSMNQTIPAWLTADLLERVQKRFTQVVGKWKATPFGSAMELEWF